MARNIVILGGGFAGLQAALHLAKKLRRVNAALNPEKQYEVTLVDRNEYHTFTPLLYEVATTSQQSANAPLLRSLVTYPFTALLHPHGVHVVRDEFKSLDLTNRAIRLANGSLAFSYLVIGLGAEPNWMNIPGLKEHALPLKTVDDALRIRDRIEAIVRAKQHRIRIVIAGGGPTGVELAAEIQGWVPELEEECKSNCDAQVVILEASPRILNGLNEEVASRAAARLAELKIVVRTGTAVKELLPSEAVFGDGERTAYDLFIWTGGIKPAEASAGIPVGKEPRGRLSVGGGMTCAIDADHELQPMIYGVGDIACFIDPATGKPVPLTARPAMLEGRIAAANIIAEIRSRESLGTASNKESFVPWNYPYIIPTGGKHAIAKIGPLLLSGWPAWIFKGFVELNYFISILPLPLAMRVWLRGFRIFIRNDRLG
jgi:NADH:ubiquinone reductase (H+-translocating)